MIVIHSQSFTAVDREGFITLVGTLPPDYQLHARSTVKNLMFSRWKAEKRNVQLELNK